MSWLVLGEKKTSHFRMLELVKGTAFDWCWLKRNEIVLRAGLYCVGYHLNKSIKGGNYAEIHVKDV